MERGSFVGWGDRMNMAKIRTSLMFKTCEMHITTISPWARGKYLSENMQKLLP
jgi:hypothetical protein